MAESSNLYYVYMLLCANGSLYTGSTANVVKRYWQHSTGKGGARFTKAFKVQSLVQCWTIEGTRGDAIAIEAFIKGQSRSFKERLLAEPKLLAQHLKGEERSYAVPRPLKLKRVLAASEVYSPKDARLGLNPLI